MKTFAVFPVQNGMGEELNSKKKFVKLKEFIQLSPSSNPTSSVRKLHSTGSGSSSDKKNKKLQPTNSPSEDSTDGECIYRNDSTQTILSLDVGKSFKGPNIERHSTENEIEVQVIDRPSSVKINPFLLSVPRSDLDSRDSSAMSLVRTNPNMDLSKLFAKDDDTPQFHDNRRRKAFDLTPLMQMREREEQTTSNENRRDNRNRTGRPRLDSADADVSDNDSDNRDAQE